MLDMILLRIRFFASSGSAFLFELVCCRLFLVVYDVRFCVLYIVYGCLAPASRLPPIQPIEAEHILKEAESKE